MISNPKKKILIINIILFAVLFGLISFNKEVLRPEYSVTGFGAILTGSFPNFIAAFIISLAMINALTFRIPEYKKLIVYGIPFLIFLILTLEEIYPMWGASSQYDMYDIIASGLGSVLAIIVYRRINND